MRVIDLRQADAMARLQALEEMRAAGLIGDDEYQAKKAEILSNLVTRLGISLAG